MAANVALDAPQPAFGMCSSMMAPPARRQPPLRAQSAMRKTTNTMPWASIAGMRSNASASTAQYAPIRTGMRAPPLARCAHRYVKANEYGASAIIPVR
jgi:hypothetical protein